MVNNKRLKIVLGGFLAALLLLVLPVIAACAPQEAAPAPAPAPVPGEKVVKVGIILDFTGPYSVTEAPMWVAWHDYWRMIEEEGGLKVNGETYRIDPMWGDSPIDVTRTLSIYKDMARKGAVCVNINSTTEAMAMLPVAQEMKVPTIGGPTSKAIVESSGYTFTLYATYPEAMSVVGDYILETWKKDRAPKVVLFGPGIGVVKAAFAQETLDYYEKIGIDVLAVELYPYTSADVITQLTRVKGLNPDFILTYMGPPFSAMHGRDGMSLGMTQNPEELRFMYGQYDIADGKNIKLAGPEPFVGHWAVNSVAILPSDAKDRPGMAKMFDTFAKYHPEQTFDTTYFMTWAPCEIMTWAIKDALGKKGYPITGEDVYQSLISMKNVDLGGLTAAPISYSETSRIASHMVRMVQYQEDGTVKPICDWRLPSDAFYQANPLLAPVK